MNTSKHLSKHIREVFFGGNWTHSNLKSNLQDINWKKATTKIDSFNTIATLVYHINYYIQAALKVLEGHDLDAKDKLSFDHPSIASQTDWDNFLNEVWINAEKFAALIEQLPEEKLWADFTDQKYGNYYRNISGIIEHTHYHLGQIVILKKLIK